MEEFEYLSSKDERQDSWILSRLVSVSAEGREEVSAVVMNQTEALLNTLRRRAVRSRGNDPHQGTGDTHALTPGRMCVSRSL